MERYYSNDGTVHAIVEGKTDNGKTLFLVYYNNSMFGVYEEHEIKLYEWAKHCHGNAPAGTPYGYFRSTYNGRKRVIVTV